MVQGERRFFRVCLNWLGKNEPAEAQNLIHFIPEYGRWDDLYCLIETDYRVTKAVFKFINSQLLLDIDSKTPSLLAKWLKSENTSCKQSRELAFKTRSALGLSARQYRKTLSLLRNRINIVETLMSQNRWDEIQFDKIPSRAGLIYKNAFAHNDITKERYAQFIADKQKKVNTAALYPYDVVHSVLKICDNSLWSHPYNLMYTPGSPEREAINKYWDNLQDYFNNSSLNALVVADTSGSMTSGYGNIAPIDVAISLALYAADRAKGPFHNHFISFSSKPALIETTGIDFCEKVTNIYRQNLCENTNIEATFDLILSAAKKNCLLQEDLPEHIVIVSDMQFDQARGRYDYYNRNHSYNSLMENIRAKWEHEGYDMPNLVFWNVNAANEGNIPMRDQDGITFVSGASPVIFEMIMSGKSGFQLMMDKLNSERYNQIETCYVF